MKTPTAIRRIKPRPNRVTPCGLRRKTVLTRAKSRELAVCGEIAGFLSSVNHWAEDCSAGGEEGYQGEEIGSAGRSKIRCEKFDFLKQLKWWSLNERAPIIAERSVLKVDGRRIAIAAEKVWCGRLVHCAKTTNPHPSGKHAENSHQSRAAELSTVAYARVALPQRFSDIAHLPHNPQRHASRHLTTTLIYHRLSLAQHRLRRYRQLLPS